MLVRRAAALAQPLPEPHGNVTQAGSSETGLVARQRKLDESVGRRWGAGQVRGSDPAASGLVSRRLLLVPAAMFAYVVVRAARKSALWRSITRLHRAGSRRQTILPG